MARLPYQDRDDVPEDFQVLLTPMHPNLGNGEHPWAPARNTWRIMAYNLPLLRAFRRFGSDIWQDSGISSREREILILSLGKGLESEYEWHNHVLMALATDRLSEEEIVAINNDDLTNFNEREEVLARYSEAFATESVDDDLHSELVTHFTESEIIGIGILGAFYVGVDAMGKAIGLDLEESFVGWDLENI